jgi:hypothetical protein
MSRTLAEFSDYAGMINAIRDRVRELEIHGEAFDEYAGLPEGYLSKLIGTNPIRRIGMTSLGPLFTALGVTCVMIENTAGTARLKKRLRPRNGSFVRSGTTHFILTSRELRRRQKNGRKNRWEKLSPEQRSEVMRVLAERRWRSK